MKFLEKAWSLVAYRYSLSRRRREEYWNKRAREIYRQAVRMDKEVSLTPEEEQRYLDLAQRHLIRRIENDLLIRRSDDDHLPACRR